jgi:hypothetical protein
MVKTVVAFRVPFDESSNISGGEKIYTCSCGMYFYVFVGRYHESTEELDVDWERLRAAKRRYKEQYPFGLFKVSRKLNKKGICRCDSTVEEDIVVPEDPIWDELNRILHDLRFNEISEKTESVQEKVVYYEDDTTSEDTSTEEVPIVPPLDLTSIPQKTWIQPENVIESETEVSDMDDTSFSYSTSEDDTPVEWIGMSPTYDPLNESIEFESSDEEYVSIQPHKNLLKKEIIARRGGLTESDFDSESTTEEEYISGVIQARNFSSDSEELYFECSSDWSDSEYATTEDSIDEFGDSELETTEDEIDLLIQEMTNLSLSSSVAPLNGNETNTSDVIKQLDALIKELTEF